ncbi:MAG: hypothetical protein V1659_01790 [Candidatus Woesearchaeota archaeon]
MNNKTVYVLAGLFFLIAVALKLFLAFSTDSFSYDGYNVIRQADSIVESAKPLYHDSLSYGGRNNLFSPLYFYILAAFSFLFNTMLVVKILPAIFSSSIVLVIYAFAERLTKNKPLSLAFSFLSIFIPVFFTETLFSGSVYSLAIPLVLLCIFLFARSDKFKLEKLSLFAVILLILIHPSSIVLLLGFVFYIALSKFFGSSPERREVEVVLFSIFFYAWFYFIIYKNALLSHGFRVIWHNLPLKLITSYFVHINVIEIMTYLGLLVSLLAVFSIYHSVFVIKRKNLLLVTATIIACVLLLLFRLMSLKEGLMYLATLFMIHAAHAVKLIFDYLKKTKLSRLAVPVVCIILLLAFVNLSASLYTSFNIKKSELPTGNDLAALKWLSLNTPSDSVILGRADEGFAIAGLAKRKNVADTSFILINNADERFNDVTRVFSLRTTAEAINIFEKYGVDYVLLTSSTQRLESISGLHFGSDNECFRLLYDNISKVYKVKCTVQKEIKKDFGLEAGD